MTETNLSYYEQGNRDVTNGNYSKAINSYFKAIKFDPNCEEEALRGLEIVSELSYQRALAGIETFREELKIHPSS